jgi:hypothetical protein
MKRLYQFWHNSPVSRQGFRTGAIGLALATMMLSACSAVESGVSNFSLNSEPNSEDQAAQDGLSDEEVTQQTQDLIGRDVTVRGAAGEKIGENAFLMTSELFGGREVIVFNNTGDEFELPELSNSPIAQVQVDGEVRQFTVADVERQYGQDLDPTLFEQFEFQPAIVADELAIVPDSNELRENPEAFYGRRIMVEGEINDIIAPDAFTISSRQFLDDSTLLVLGATPDVSVDNGEVVTVVGELRPFVASSIERDYDLTWDLDLQEQLEVEYANQPILVAREVYPSDRSNRAAYQPNLR